MIEPTPFHELHLTREPVAALHTYHRNPRRGDVSAIHQSLLVNGQYRPLVVNRGTHTDRPNEVLAGNHALLAARQAGWSDVAVCWVDVDDERAARIVAADNRTADLGEYDDQMLADLLADLPDLDGTGYEADDLDALARLLDDGQPVTGNTDPDEAPEPPVEPLSAVGDVWLLGDHRLVVGDATDPATWEAALDGQRVDALWTDPPYGVSYVGKTSDELRIENDTISADSLTQLLDATFDHALRHSNLGACWYVAAPPGPLFLTFATVLERLGVWRQTLTWVKDQFVLGRSDYHYRHEPILYGWAPGGAHRPPPNRTQDSVHEVARPRASRDHPTMKPVELIERHLGNSTEPGALVVDPFAGSGSTLIAAHRIRRRAALIEIDPRYADVTCRRFQEHTGIHPVHLASNEPRDFTAAATPIPEVVP